MEPKLHDWSISEREYARHEARRGRRHAYERIDPARTALVVVDMVPFHVAESPYALGIVANINALAGPLRRAGGVVAWVLPAVTPEPRPWATAFFGAAVAAMYRLLRVLGA